MSKTEGLPSGSSKKEKRGRTQFEEEVEFNLRRKFQKKQRELLLERRTEKTMNKSLA